MVVKIGTIGRRVNGAVQLLDESVRRSRFDERTIAVGSGPRLLKDAFRYARVRWCCLRPIGSTVNVLPRDSYAPFRKQCVCVPAGWTHLVCPQIQSPAPRHSRTRLRSTSVFIVRGIKRAKKKERKEKEEKRHERKEKKNRKKQRG